MFLAFAHWFWYTPIGFWHWAIIAMASVSPYLTIAVVARWWDRRV